MSQQFTRLDANESIFFARELESIKAKSYDVLYPEFKARMFVPISNEAGPGAEAITYSQFDQVGMAKLIAAYADDLPRSDIKGVQFTSPVKSIGASYGYNVQEIRAARMANKPLEQRKANAARRAVMQKEDEILATGDSATGLKGFINHSSVPIFAAPFVITSASTPDQILQTLNASTNKIVADTKGVEMPDTLLLPIEQYTYIASTPRSSTSDTTILEYFLQNNPFIQNVDHWYKLDQAGVASVDRMVVYKRSPDKLSGEVPQEYEQFAPEQRGLEFVVAAHQRIGGVLFYYPLSALYVDGV
jgi:hypothetical protein